MKPTCEVSGLSSCHEEPDWTPHSAVDPLFTAPLLDRCSVPAKWMLPFNAELTSSTRKLPFLCRDITCDVQHLDQFILNLESWARNALYSLCPDTPYKCELDEKDWFQTK